jgi:serine-type D-Ala-D-Ala carboxypeptidase/endopeptidase
MRRVLHVAALGLLAACGGDRTAPVEPPNEPTPAARWAAVDSVAQAMIAANPAYSRFTVSVYNASNERVYERSYGGFSPTQNIAIASASKWIAGVVLLDAVARGELSLTSTTAQRLGWTGQAGTITLRHLLSFTSGMVPEAACTLNLLTTLEACVAAIAQQPLVAPPGTRYDYGSTHLHVAARMAEVASGRTWQQLVRERLTDPLGLPADVRFYTYPNQGLGVANPLVAGGMRASAHDYAKLLGLIYHKGRLGNVTLANPALFDEQAREPYPGVVIGSSPAQSQGWSFRYGLAAWLQCATPAVGCAVLSSPGAFGFTPWIDRSAGYYATVAMEETIGSGAAFGTALSVLLEPHIRRAVAAR